MQLDGAATGRQQTGFGKTCTCVSGSGSLATGPVTLDIGNITLGEIRTAVNVWRYVAVL